VIKIADMALSTGGMQTFVKKSDRTSFIIGTELGLIHRLEKENPGRKFYHVSEKAVCPNMKKINLEKIMYSLQEMKEQVVLSEEIISKAKKSIERMMEYVD
jgi:quinolinate synthase